MEAKDLRIGNLIHDNRGNIIDIESIGMDGVNLRGSYVDCTDAYYKWNELKPIPLTEEWLLKFGFKFDTISHVLNVKGINISVMFYDCYHVTIESKDGYFELNYSGFPDIHELQNMVALSGVELHIK